MAQPPGGFAPRKAAPPAKAGTPYDVDALKRVTGRFLTEAPLGIAKGMVEPLFGMPTSDWGKGTRAALAGVRSVLPGGGSYEDERQRIAKSDEARYPGVGSVIPEVRDQAVQRGTAQDALIMGSSMMPAEIKAPALSVVREGPYSRSALPTSTYKNVEHAVMDLMDDRSHGDDVLAAAASEVAKEKFPSSGGGFGGSYPATKDALREYLDAVIRRANELSEDY